MSRSWELWEKHKCEGHENNIVTIFSNEIYGNGPTYYFHTILFPSKRLTPWLRYLHTHVTH